MSRPVLPPGLKAFPGGDDPKKAREIAEASQEVVKALGRMQERCGTENVLCLLQGLLELAEEGGSLGMVEVSVVEVNVRPERGN